MGNGNGEEGRNGEGRGDYNLDYECISIRYFLFRCLFKLFQFISVPIERQIFCSFILYFSLILSVSISFCTFALFRGPDKS